MTFKNIAILGTQDYLSFLEGTEKGNTITNVVSISEEDGAYWLTLANALGNTDSSKVKLHDTIYEASDIKILVYSKAQKLVKISVKQWLKPKMDSLKPENICIVSDMKFLVQRVLDWYKQTNCTFSIGNGMPTAVLEADLQQSGNPSDEQRRGIECALNNPFSYIWGAPGTGKTKLVLARCVLSHIQAGHKVLIAAPTNNAVEQTLYGVLPVLKEAGVLGEETVLRLGAASPRFCKDYPDACEDLSATTVIETLREELREAEATRDTLKEQLTQWKRFEAFLNLVSNVRTFEIQYPELLAEIESVRKVLEEEYTYRALLNSEHQQKSDELKKTVAEIKTSTHSLEDITEKIQKHEKSILHVLFPQKMANLARTRDIEYEKLVKLNEQKNNLSNRIAEIVAEKPQLDSKIANNKRDEKEKTEKLIHRAQCIPGLDAVQQGFDMETQRSKIVDAIAAFCATEQKIKAEFEAKNLPDKSAVQSALDNQLDQIQKIKDRLSLYINKDVRVRIKNCQVLAATVDTCIGRVPADDVSFQQVFLDEAAYCCYMKAATLYSYGCPLAILGDHKQLPPVCEMPRTEFEKHNFSAFWAMPSIYLKPRLSFEQAKVAFDLFMDNEMPFFGDVAKVNLTQTYRFGCSIADTLNKFVYKNGFKGNINARTKIYFIDAPMIKGVQKNTSPAECAAITAYCNAHPDEDIAILTPYTNQKKLLFKEPLLYLNKLDSVLTIHGSQGREWDTVIISVVDAAKKWFMSVKTPGSNGEQVINTAVSRAKKKLIFVCDTSFWQSDKELLSVLLKQAKDISQAEDDIIFDDWSDDESLGDVPQLPEAPDPNDFFKGCTSEKEIRVRYRQLMLRYHPDVGGDAELAKKINEQYKNRIAQ